MGGRWLSRVIVCNVDIGSKVTNLVMGILVDNMAGVSDMTDWVDPSGLILSRLLGMCVVLLMRYSWWGCHGGGYLYG